LDESLKKQQQLEREIAVMKILHREEIVKKNKAITSLELHRTYDLKLKAGKQQDLSRTDSSTKADLAIENKALIAAEQQLKDERAKHQVALKESEAAYKQQLEEQWQLRLEGEKEKARITAEKLREEEKTQFEAEETRRQELRQELLGKAKKHNLGIQAILDRQKDGTLALTKEEEIPSKETCIKRLTELWASRGASVTQILPHELMVNHDSALEFEVEIMVTARVCMLAMQLWGYTPDELLGTGWSLSAVQRLKYGLVPYQNDTPLSSLSVAVADICDMLQQAVNDRKSGQAHGAPFIQPNNLPISFVPSTMTHPVLAFDQNLASSIGMNDEAPAGFIGNQQLFVSQPYEATQAFTPTTHNYIPSWQQTTGENEKLLPPSTESDTDMAMAPAPAEIYQSVPAIASNTSHQQQGLVSYSTNKAPINQQIFAPKGDVCHHFANFGKCKFRDKCKYSHDVAPSDQQIVAP
jgi:hypothetical protein